MRSMPRTVPLEVIRDGLFPKYRLKEDFEFVFELPPYRYFTIPAGFEYDGATMGSFLFWRKSLHKTPETLAHDYLYVKLGDVNARHIYGNYPAKPFTKKEIDDMFLRAARRTVNVQDWRAAIASGVFKTIGSIMWYFRKVKQ